MLIKAGYCRGPLLYVYKATPLLVHPTWCCRLESCYKLDTDASRARSLCPRREWSGVVMVSDATYVSTECPRVGSGGGVLMVWASREWRWSVNGLGE